MTIDFFFPSATYPSPVTSRDNATTSLLASTSTIHNIYIWPSFPLFPGLSGAGSLPHLDTNCSDQGPSETEMAAVSFRSLLWRHCFLTISYCCVFLSFGMGVAFLGPTLLDLGKKGFVCIHPLTQTIPASHCFPSSSPRPSQYAPSFKTPLPDHLNGSYLS